jgi:hypothetical protein
MTSLLPPYEDAEVAALMAWLDCWRELIDRRYPPEDPPPKPAPRSPSSADTELELAE